MLAAINWPGAHMGFFSNIAYRWKKSKKVRRLQLVIAARGPRVNLTRDDGGTVTVLVNNVQSMRWNAAE